MKSTRLARRPRVARPVRRVPTTPPTLHAAATGLPPLRSSKEMMGEVVLASSGMLIQAGGIFELPIKVDRPSVLRIRFEVDEGYDVDFALKFLEDAEGSTPQTLVMPARSTAREGQLDIHTTGTCFVIWDNAFSWINSKSLTYHLSLKSKEDIERARRIEQKRLAELKKQAAKEQVIVRRQARANLIKELEGKLADMLAYEHEARGRLMAKQGELKRLEAEYNAAKAGIVAIADGADRAEELAAELQQKLSDLLEQAAQDEEDNALDTVE
mmetsp:Transcript_8852/g.22936  ORF Transcript_8852/g.22936 Transcript_8852/m.22936 type:complete len:270 (-) Transcript_8852:430-1239(-)